MTTDTIEDIEKQLGEKITILSSQKSALEQENIRLKRELDQEKRTLLLEKERYAKLNQEFSAFENLSEINKVLEEEVDKLTTDITRINKHLDAVLKLIDKYFNE